MLSEDIPPARYVKLWVAHAPGIPGTFSPPPRVNNPDMHHGTCVTHVPWCMPGSLTSGFLWSWWRENVPGILSACATSNFTYLVRGPWRHVLQDIESKLMAAILRSKGSHLLYCRCYNLPCMQLVCMRWFVFPVCLLGPLLVTWVNFEPSKIK